MRRLGERKIQVVSAGKHRRFGIYRCPYLQDQSVREEYIVTVLRTVGNYLPVDIPEDLNIQRHCCEHVASGYCLTVAVLLTAEDI